MRKQVLAFLTLACLTVFFAGCAKEKSFETGFGPSAGSLQSETTGDCLPKNVAGIYEATVALTADNYIEVDVDVTTAGSYTIRTDTVNGFSFKAQGYFTATGKQTVKLMGSGTPANKAISNFTVSYAGTNCVVSVSVLPQGASGPAAFELIGSPNSCSGAIVDGVYGEGIALNNSHTVTLNVNVTTIGVYNITTTTTNGITFKGTGALIDLGPTTIVLTGSGTPGPAGLYSIPIAGPNSCTFDVTVVGPAAYTMDCNSIVVNGTYAANTNLGATNTIKLTVDVTSVGPYSITTTAVDGMIFTGSGNFGATGLTDVTLNGTGKPGSAGNKTITINGVNGQTCTGDIVVSGAPDPSAAIYTIEGTGSPLLCSGATPTGEYLIGVALNPSVNKVTVKANVTKAGTANITTGTVNGIKFSFTGSFPTVGNYNVELVASGTPSGTLGTVNFTLPFSGSSCGFSVTTKAPAQYTINCPSVVVNGTYTGSTPLTSTNTITVGVNVTSTGPYSISTTTTNGITFSGTGEFTATGAQTVTLAGSGTPSTGGSTILHGFPTTPVCTFSITYGGSPTPCTNLSDDKFNLIGRFSFTGISFSSTMGPKYQISLVSGIKQLDIFFPTSTFPGYGTFNIGAVTMQVIDENFTTNGITWKATSGRIYVVKNSAGDAYVEFCDVSFTGTSIFGGNPITAKGEGRLGEL